MARYTDVVPPRVVHYSITGKGKKRANGAGDVWGESHHHQLTLKLDPYLVHPSISRTSLFHTALPRDPLQCTPTQSSLNPQDPIPPHTTMKVYSLSLLSVTPGSPAQATLLGTAQDLSSFSFYQRGSVGEFMTFFTKASRALLLKPSLIACAPVLTMVSRRWRSVPQPTNPRRSKRTTTRRMCSVPLAGIQRGWVSPVSQSPSH